VRTLRRQLWLGAGCFALMLGSLLIALQAMRLDAGLHVRHQQAIATGVQALQIQQQLAAVGMLSAPGRADAVAALKRQAAALVSANDAAADAAAAVDIAAALPPLLAALDAIAQAPADAAPPVAAAGGALAALLVAQRAAADREHARVEEFRRFARHTLIGAALLTVLMGLLFGVLALRGVAAHRRLYGQLDELAHTDGLTGVFNRRELDERLPVEIARADRLAYPFTLVMLDLDHFKRYNDRRGHAAGDTLLRGAAQAWRKQLRPTDLLARYGGEEFTLVLPACDAEQAAQLVERLRPLMPDRQTFSAGIAERLPAEDGADLLRRADAALLYAKKSGRNRSVVAGTEPQIALPLKTA
jgi:diguanylate cyclase (GGDEF)-like protein